MVKAFQKENVINVLWHTKDVNYEGDRSHILPKEDTRDEYLHGYLHY